MVERSLCCVTGVDDMEAAVLSLPLPEECCLLILLYVQNSAALLIQEAWTRYTVPPLISVEWWPMPYWSTAAVAAVLQIQNPHDALITFTTTTMEEVD